MPNPYLAAALKQQQERRKAATKTPEAPAPVEKAAESAAKSDNPPSKEK